MENTKPKTKISSKKVPIICLILCVVLGPFNSTLGGFFFLISFISFLVCRMQDNIPATGSTEYNALNDWNLPEESESMEFDMYQSTGSGASPASAGCTAEVQVTATESIGRSYTDM